jgi:transposase
MFPSWATVYSNTLSPVKNICFILLRINDIVRGKEFSENVSMKETVTLNSQDQQRIKILNQLLGGELSNAQAASLLKCSERHVYRMKASYREKGAAAMVHGNRGRVSSRRISAEVRALVVTLACGTYAGCNQHHLRDLLEEREGIKLSRASVRRILQAGGVYVIVPRKRPKHRLRRPRYRQEGQLVQIDGSPHAWLEERGPRLCLMGGIDDATGKVVGAIFAEQETQQGYFQALRQMVEQYGSPLTIYHDRHTMFPARARQATERDSISEQLAGTRTTTQLGRLFEQLQIVSIAARSPQAKGRIERLWGTLQDRLVSELRLAGACTLEQANQILQAYVPRFNAQFAVPAADLALAWQAVPASLTLDECFCWQEERSVALDNTVSYYKRRLQLLPTQTRQSWARAKVKVYESLDGTLRVFAQGQCIPSRPAPADPAQARASQQHQAVGGEPGSAAAAEPGSPPTSVCASSTRKPKATHPWRRKAIASPPP